ncbi:hypothetical protein GF377_08940 [candidate division GN15 bacterium]|nr:hypothetical protein [candidate division GN15 bacterium]
MGKYIGRYIVVGVLLLGTALLLGVGCTSKLDGTQEENQRPLVWFVNVPPEGATSSVNPIVNWVGRDRDGVIEYFRYIVIREDQIGTALGKPQDWNPADEPLTETEVQTYVDGTLLNADDTLWTYLYVDNEAGDPKTSNIIPMEAEITSPVLELVQQFVFLQAFDEVGLGSQVAFRRFLRNDNPPDTEIRAKGNIEGARFINSPFPSGSATGIRLRWEASDVLDHPSDPPPFEYEWRLFGPFTEDEMTTFKDSFEVQVFVTNDAQVFRFGQPSEFIIDSIVCDSVGDCDTFGYLFPTAYIVCDTTFENGSEVETCDTLIIDTIQSSNIYGTIDTILRVKDDDFLNSPLNRVADSSDDGTGFPWVTEERDSIYDVYAGYPSDTTVQLSFVFWIRSRDDAKVPDLTPDYATFDVIEPKRERDVVIMSMLEGSNINFPKPDSLRDYYRRAIESWAATRPGDSIVFDTAQETDYFNMALWEFLTDGYQDLFLRILLKYKVVIIIQDEVISPGRWGEEGGWMRPDVYTALQTGVNVWVLGRSPIGGFGRTQWLQSYSTTPAYQSAFGVTYTEFAGWGLLAQGSGGPFSPEKVYIEDFNEALSLNPDRWPNLEVDKELVYRRYRWRHNDRLGVIDTSGIEAIGGVNWQARTYDTEVQYLYGSIYGESEHAFGAEYTYAGRPVAHRLNRGLFRTAHWLFSPMAMEEDSAQVVFNDMMDWLFEGGFGLSSTRDELNRKAARNSVSMSDLENQYWEAFYSSNSREEFRQRLENLSF